MIIERSKQFKGKLQCVHFGCATIELWSLNTCDAQIAKYSEILKLNTVGSFNAFGYHLYQYTQVRLVI